MKESHFSLNNNELYKHWRNLKLSFYPVGVAELFVEIEDENTPDRLEINQIHTLIQRYNLALYRYTNRPTVGKKEVHYLAQAVGLRTLDANLCADPDSLTSVQVAQHTGQHDYIPYTDKKLSWHTDGYYNTPEQQIHGMLLHCVRPAPQGGETLLMDSEMAYLLLREADPAYIQALMHPQAFTIPANVLNGEVIRPEQSGPVFAIRADGSLHMRYSARQRNVIWRQDAATQAAERFLLDLWEQGSPYMFRHTLQAGEGVLCNNVLHCRTEFVDAQEAGARRLLYRGRYLERVTPDTTKPQTTPAPAPHPAAATYTPIKPGIPPQ